MKNTKKKVAKKVAKKASKKSKKTVVFKKVAVPIDLSHVENGIRSIRIAKKLLGKNGKILLINIVEEIPTYVSVELPRNILKDSRTFARKQLQKIATKAGVDVKIIVQTGHPASAILESVKKHDADLIIVASHKPGLSDYFLGSTAARVVRHARVPVFVNR